MRLSLTRKQLESQVGPASKLLQLLEEITADGKISEDEIAKLNNWILQNQGVDLPAVAYFKILLEEILADGKVTTDERRSLQIAAERVLPTDRRNIARARRLGFEAAEKAALNEARQADKQRVREFRELNRPEHFDFMVAGVKYEDRALIIQTFLKINDTVYLARAPDNPYDGNAVIIRLSNGGEIAYVPREHAVSPAPLLDSGFRQRAFCKKLLGQLPIPVIVADLYNHQAVVAEAIEPSAIPQKRDIVHEIRPTIPVVSTPRPTKVTQERSDAPGAVGTGCGLVAILVIACLTLLVILSLR